MKLPRRRRLQKKTDYKSRLALLKSGLPRLVIRKTNRYIIAQIVESEIAQDKVLAYTNSKSLLQNGWPNESLGSLKNIQAAYLTGLLLGKSLKEKPKEIILDIGMHRNIQKARLYAVLKGALDSGLLIKHDSAVLPTDEDLKANEKFAPLISKLKGDKADGN